MGTPLQSRAAQPTTAQSTAAQPTAAQSPTAQSTTLSARTLPHRPGKIIAVHLSYASRAEQRGRTPRTPSYFLKPSSSAGSSAGVIEQPAGTELLAFEGEIALVIGELARRVPLAEAWEHVAFVTAANDFGLYDLRAADKGSNVRSKGGDGFTPLGPDMIDARTVDPTDLRIRTWVNDQLVQADTTAGLLFPLTQFVADLSQHLTLEPGDVILTGTPAGSSVVGPGDVIEVEVDSPTTGASSGRLSTTVIADTVTRYDAALGATPSVDDAQRIAAWGSAEAAGLAEPATGSGTSAAASSDTPPGTSSYLAPLSSGLRAKLAEAPTASLASQLRKRGLNNVVIDGVHAMPGSAKLVGVARTLRFVPNREDLFTSHGGGYNAQKRAFDSLRTGEVMVIEARGDLGAGTLGDVLALRAQVNGAAGVVTDGAVRDYQAVAAMGLPVYSAAAHPAVLGRKHVPWDADITIGCGGATVQPGDIIVGDGDGVIVIPPALAEDVADAALAQEESDGWIAERVAEGHRLQGLFPMDDEWRARYRAHRSDRQAEPPAEPPAHRREDPAV